MKERGWEIAKKNFTYFTCTGLSQAGVEMEMKH